MDFESKVIVDIKNLIWAITREMMTFPLGDKGYHTRVIARYHPTATKLKLMNGKPRFFTICFFVPSVTEGGIHTFNIGVLMIFLW